MFVCAECGQRHDQPGYCPADGRPLVPTDDPLLGTDVGRYRLASLIGEGGMGRVYLGVQPSIGSRVAVKILSDQCARDPALLERFFAEAKAVNLIRHESIVSVLDLSRLADGRPYIVMEYIEGSTLGLLVRPSSGPPPLGGIVQIITEVLSALEAAHAIGIVHRDLKPDNIVITGEGHAKVLDFGIAKLAPGLSHLSPRTATGALLGTPAYMAPEQIGGGTVDPRTDVYAIGIVFYEAVTGRVPFTGETLFDLMRQHLEAAPLPPSRLRPDLPPELEHVILTALEKNPARRFQTALAMAEAASQASSHLPPDQWRALSRGGVITGGRQSMSKLMSPSGRRPAPSRQPPMSIGHDATHLSLPPNDGATRDLRTAPSGHDMTRDLRGSAPIHGLSDRRPDPAFVASSPMQGRTHRPSEAEYPRSAAMDGRTHRPSEAEYPRTVASPMDGRMDRPSEAELARDRGAPDRRSEAELARDRALWGAADRPRVASSPNRVVYDPSNPAAATQLAPSEKRRSRWPVILAIVLSAGLATTITLLVMRSSADATLDGSAAPGTPTAGSSTEGSSAAQGPPGSATGPGAPTNPGSAGQGSSTAQGSPGPGSSTAQGAPTAQGSPTGPGSSTAQVSPTGQGSSTGPNVPTGQGSSQRSPTGPGSAVATGSNSRPGGPIIVGGGSAIDHGVSIGPGVTIGPNVIIGSGPKPTQKPGVVDYNPTKFDPLAYLPKAKALARQIYPDAELTEFEFYENVLPDGSVDLTLKSSSTSYYEFRSPSHSIFPPTRNATADDIPCYVMVHVTATSIKARVREDDECKHPLRAPPRCTFAEVWRLSRTKDTIPATIGYLNDGTWFFDHDHAGKRSGQAVTTSVKDCR